MTPWETLIWKVTPGQITPHFNIREFHCHDGILYPHQWVKSRLRPLCEAAEEVRAVTERAGIILSGYRHAAYNASIPGAAANSMHIHGLAMDFRVEGYSGYRLHSIFEDLIRDGTIPDGGLGMYPNRVHYDLRGILDLPPARW